MTNVISNLMNGNLKAAKTGAKRYGCERLRDFMVNELGWGSERAWTAVAFLKLTGSFDAYCKAEQKEKHGNES